MSSVEVFRPKSNVLFANFNYLFLAGFLISELYIGVTVGSITLIAWCVAFGALNHLALVKPRLIVGSKGITIVNPIHTHEIGWGSVQAIDARYTMYVVANDERIHAWAAPAPGRYHARNIVKNELRGSGLDRRDYIKTGELPNSLSGSALIICRRAWESARESADVIQRASTTLNATGIWIAGAALVIALTSSLI